MRMLGFAARSTVPRRYLLLALLAVSGCHPLPRPHSPSLAASVPAQREAALAQYRDWTMRGRLGLANGHQGGSGSFSWQQRGDHYDFSLRKPITGGLVFRLQGDPRGAELTDADGHRRRAADGEALMQQVLGWSVPLQALQAWVLGVRAPGLPARVVWAGDGLPSRIEQAGWQIDYPSWIAASSPARPHQIFAARPPYKLRLSVESWHPGTE